MPTRSADGPEVAFTSLDGIFSDAVARFPERTALYIVDRYWTYSQLNVHSIAIERVLRNAGLADQRRNIGLVYARSAFSYAAIIAILRSGNVYIPLSDKLSVERLTTVINDAAIDAIIVDSSDRPCAEISAALAESGCHHIITNDPSSTLRNPRCQIWRVTTDSCEFSAEGSSAPPSRPESTVAYIIYTSGSTGTPKGVPISHQSICRCMERLRRLFGTRESDRFTQFCPLSFDGSIFEIFLCWVSGGALFVPPEHQVLLPLDFVLAHKISVWGSVPSVASFMLKLKLLGPGRLSHLRLSFFFGEALPVELARAWATTAPNSRIFNLYGPTEFTICATYYEFDAREKQDQDVVPIGTVLPDLSSMIVDEGRKVSEDGIPGELWLSGDQLALGYWNNPSATKAAFVRFSSGESPEQLWYRTGDLVSYRSGVGLSFRGRLDRQVKLRGLRIELQEVETALREVIQCSRVAVIPIANTGGMFEKIYAYCDAADVDEAEIKADCRRLLPQYMIPERIFQLMDFPLSSHGKIDYRAIAAHADTAPVAGV